MKNLGSIIKEHQINHDEFLNWVDTVTEGVFEQDVLSESINESEGNKLSFLTLLVEKEALKSAAEKTLHAFKTLIKGNKDVKSVSGLKKDKSGVFFMVQTSDGKSMNVYYDEKTDSLQVAEGMSEEFALLLKECANINEVKNESFSFNEDELDVIVNSLISAKNKNVFDADGLKTVDALLKKMN